MKCSNCEKELIWGGDHTYEDYGINDMEGVVSNLTCPNEKCNVEIIIIYYKT